MGATRLTTTWWRTASVPLPSDGRTICSAAMTKPPREPLSSTPSSPPARRAVLMKGPGLRMSSDGSRNTSRAGRTTRICFRATGAFRQTKSNRHPTNTEENNRYQTDTGCNLIMSRERADFFLPLGSRVHTYAKSPFIICTDRDIFYRAAKINDYCV